MTKKDFFVITESYNLCLDLAPPTLEQARNIAENLAPVSREQRKSKDAKRWNAIYKKLLDERAQ